MLPTAADVVAAAERLRGVAERTPLLHSPRLSSAAGADVYLKCENLQRTGSFKIRGAYNALVTLPPDLREKGIVASSAGNHGLGIAMSAQLLGLRARIFMPADAPGVKRDGILALGAEVDSSHPHYDAAHAAAEAYAVAHGMTFVNPCAGQPLLAGQGTVALEVVADLPALATMVVPVGGGGLVGGVGALLRAHAPGVRIVGAQSEHTDAMARSLAADRRVEIGNAPTLADGLAGQIDDEGLAIGQFAIDEMVVVSESQVADAVAWLAQVHGLRVEGSGAVGVAAVRAYTGTHWRGPIAVVVSGGNIDDACWESIVGRPVMD